jgi:hypothetical protein
VNPAEAVPFALRCSERTDADAIVIVAGVGTHDVPPSATIVDLLDDGELDDLLRLDVRHDAQLHAMA